MLRSIQWKCGRLFQITIIFTVTKRTLTFVAVTKFFVIFNHLRYTCLENNISARSMIAHESVIFLQWTEYCSTNLRVMRFQLDIRQMCCYTEYICVDSLETLPHCKQPNRPQYATYRWFDYANIHYIHVNLKCILVNCLQCFHPKTKFPS